MEKKTYISPRTKVQRMVMDSVILAGSGPGTMLYGEQNRVGTPTALAKEYDLDFDDDFDDEF